VSQAGDLSGVAAHNLFGVISDNSLLLWKIFNDELCF